MINDITNSKCYKVFYWLQEAMMNFMGYWFFISVIGIVALMDYILNPQGNSIQDEGIYFGFLVVAVLLSVLTLWLYIQLSHFMPWLIFRDCYKYYFGK